MGVMWFGLGLCDKGGGVRFEFLGGHQLIE